MMKSLIFILSLISFCCAEKLGSLSDSSTADFTVLAKNNNYEVRRFANLTWVSEIANTLVYDESNFVDLFNYMNGENSEGIEVKGSSPVITGIAMRPCAFCSFNSSKLFYVSSNDQTDLPLPLSDKILLLPFNEFEVYVRSFEGNPDLEEFMRQTNTLLEDLKEDGISESDLYIEYFYMIKYENSINEVLLVKK